MQAKGSSGLRGGPGRVVLASALAALALLATATSAWGMQAVAPDGSVFVAWEDVQVTRIDPDGVPSGVIHDIAPEPQYPPGPDQTENSHLTGIAVAPSGVVTLVWMDIVGWDARIVTRQLAPDGTPLGEPVELAAKQEIHIRPHLGMEPDGSAIVVWGRPAPGGGEIVMRRIAPDGTPEEGVDVVTSDGDPYRFAMATAPDGTATVVWNRKEGEGTVLLERRIAPDGTLETSTDQLGESDWAMGEPHVAVAADGTATVLWQRWGHTEDEEIWTRQVGPDGSPESEAHLLDADERVVLPDLEVAADGTALASWLSREPGRQAVFIAPDGTPAASGPITVGGSVLDEWPNVVASPDGDFKVSWSGDCGSKECLRVGEIDEDLEVTDLVTLDEGGRLGNGAGVFLADGTVSYLWSQRFIANWGEAALRTRRIEPDGTLGPIYYLYKPQQYPFVQLFPDSVEFGAVQLGSGSSRSVGVFVEAFEPLGTFSTSISGPDADRFAVDGTTCSGADAHPTNCAVSVSFHPDEDGPATAQLVVEAGEGIPVTVDLSGEGVVPPSEHTGPPPPSSPDPLVQLGKARPDRATGVATLPVAVSGPGRVEIFGPCVGGSAAERSARIDAAGNVEMEVVARGHCRRQLLRKGTTRFGVRVTFIAADGQMTVGHRPVRLRLAS